VLQFWTMFLFLSYGFVRQLFGVGSCDAEELVSRWSQPLPWLVVVIWVDGGVAVLPVVRPRRCYVFCFCPCCS
jgi:hypothetical protein